MATSDIEKGNTLPKRVRLTYNDKLAVVHRTLNKNGVMNKMRVIIIIIKRRRKVLLLLFVTLCVLCVAQQLTLAYAPREKGDEEKLLKCSHITIHM